MCDELKIRIMKNVSTFPGGRPQYSSPKVSVILLNNQDVICQSSFLGEEMQEGDGNW